MKIAIIQSKVTQHWGYCPEAALPFFQLMMEYAGDETGHLTATAAIKAACADKTMPDEKLMFTVLR